MGASAVGWTVGGVGCLFRLNGVALRFLERFLRKHFADFNCAYAGLLMRAFRGSIASLCCPFVVTVRLCETPSSIDSVQATLVLSRGGKRMK